MMTEDNEIRFKCLEMAIAQAQRAGAINFRDTVAELQDWLYTRIVNAKELDKVAVKPPPLGLNKQTPRA
jgi:hypothetical protein